LSKSRTQGSMQRLRARATGDFAMFHHTRLISIAASVAILVGGAAVAAVATSDQATAKTVKAKTAAKSAPASRGGRDAPAAPRSTYQSY
jgi:hypothetical protein